MESGAAHEVEAGAAHEVESGAALEADHPMRHHKHYLRNKRGKDSPYAGGSSFMESMSEKVASGMGTVAFLVVSTSIILAWVFSNHLIKFLNTAWHGLITGKGFDPRAVHPPQPRLLGGGVLHGRARDHRPEGADAGTDRANEEANAAHREEGDSRSSRRSCSSRTPDLTKEGSTSSPRQLQGLTEDVHSASVPADGRARAL